MAFLLPLALVSRVFAMALVLPLSLVLARVRHGFFTSAVNSARVVAAEDAMTATVYKDLNFQGVYAQLRPGFYSGRDLVGCPHLSTNCEDLDNAISSIRVDPNTVVAFADSHALSASGGGGARVLVGPAEVPDLAALGMSGRISSVRAVPYRAYDSATPPPAGGATIYDSYGMTGRRAALRRGDYASGRLTSEEVRLSGPSVMSVSVNPGVILILYAGANFETASDAVMVVGPAAVEDLDRVGMGGRVRSIRVLYGDVPTLASWYASARPGDSLTGDSLTGDSLTGMWGVFGRPRGGSSGAPAGGLCPLLTYTVVGPTARAWPSESVAAGSATTPKGLYWMVLLLFIITVALSICAAKYYNNFKYTQCANS